MSEGLVLVARAMEFAAHKHSSQRRKGLTAEPYVNHLAEVARLLAESSGGRDAELVAAGLLHDTLEDTATTAAELEREFGAGILGLVREVTDDKSLPKQERKRLQVEHAPHLPLPAKLVKLADKTSNVREISENPPHDWSMERRMEYLDWAVKVVAGCRGTNEALESHFDDTLRRAWERLQSL